jgi:hypothetical protein
MVNKKKVILEEGDEDDLQSPTKQPSITIDKDKDGSPLSAKRDLKPITTPAVQMKKAWFSTEQRSRVSNLGGLKRVINPVPTAPEYNNRNYGSYHGTYSKFY